MIRITAVGLVSLGASQWLTYTKCDLLCEGVSTFIWAKQMEESFEQ